LQQLDWNGGGGKIKVLNGATPSMLASGAGVNPEPQSKFIPEEYALFQNYPNPFNLSTLVQYDLPEESDVRIVVYDVLGREVVTLVNDRIEA
jgi:hypothetical protein